MTQITLDDEKIKKLLLEKEELVTSGRKVSNEIEKIEAKIAKNDQQQRELTTKVEPKELVAKGEALQKEINAKLEELNEVGNQILKAKLDGIPEDVKKEYYVLKDEKEKLEKERNKIALKVQKIKDKVIPMIQKKVKPDLKEFEDMSGAIVKGEKVIITTFSHLEDFKKRFAQKK